MTLDDVVVWAEFQKPQLADNDDGTPGEMMTACTSGLPVDWTSMEMAVLGIVESIPV